MTMGTRLRRVLRREWREWLAFVLFTAPGLAVFGVFTYWPILRSAYLSLLDYSPLSAESRFVALANYRRLFADPVFWRVGANTLVYAVSVVCLAQGLAFFLALLLDRPMPGRAVLRTLAFTPYVTATAAAALTWVLLLDPEFGPLSLLYNALGVDGPRWLARSGLALCALIVVGVWREIGFASMFFLAGLQGLPRDCYEAARIDGGSRWQTLRHVTVPLMSPVIFFLLVSGFIAATKAFDVVAMMTEGGPVYPASSTYVYHLYRVAFQHFDFGYASAFAMVFFVVTVCVTLLQFRVARWWVYYEDVG